MTRIEELLAEAKRRTGEPVPLLFTAFCAWVGISLSPGQRVIARVAYDGVEPAELPAEERALAALIFGPVDRIAKQARDVVTAVCGARAGKTYVIEAMRLLHLALTVPLTTLAPGEIASAPIIQPDKDLAQQALGYVKGAVASRPELAAMVVHESTESIDLKRPDGATVEIVCRAASARGRTGRGRTLVGAAMGEAAFFRDANYQVNDEEVYQALTPRIVPGGQLIISSTPWTQAGLLFQLFSDNHPTPSCAGITSRPVNAGTALAIHAPTLLLRDTEHMRTTVEREEKRDPENALREFGARFMSVGTSTFFDAAAINAAIDEDLALPRKPKPGDEVCAGGDFGFDKNSSTLAITHKRGTRVLVGDLREQKPEPGTPLKPSAVVADFAETLAWHGCGAVMADRHYRRAVQEHLETSDIAFLDAPASPDVAFVRANALLREGRLSIPNHPRLLRQMRETMSRRKPGGGVTIILPKWRTGEHGDLVSALVLAAFQSAGDLVVLDTKPKAGTPAFFAAEEKRLEEAAIEDEERKEKLEWWEL